jgi:hypothetical protein
MLEGISKAVKLLVSPVVPLWEWPIAAHVQKLILFGLLPPLTWMLAATIENNIY